MIMYNDLIDVINLIQTIEGKLNYLNVILNGYTN
jgi:hypothetical protein